MHQLCRYALHFRPSLGGVERSSTKQRNNKTGRFNLSQSGLNKFLLVVFVAHDKECRNQAIQTISYVHIANDP